ncbi:CLUMA_CG019089, isoform A [Clunio marinus]|uniref:CLUMA_CG019089, isoform A n=1 Tax=Clunio marinus TaxID=568069 RepID=A0A1J1J2A0_9DIPT|nr:CLUMA_CG019089, isoform A [Clunio marinus]
MVIEDSLLLKENFINDVREFVKKKNWRKILVSCKKYGINVTSETLWTFPSEYCVTYLKALWKSFNITNVLSIGCGTGLMEFILRESIGIRVTGLEVDKNWWSRHKPFIPLKFLDPGQEITSKFLLDTCLSKNWNFSLMFCYFNNRKAFDEYVKCYKGNYVIIIGPAANTMRYTEPLPLDKEFQENENYKLIHVKEFGDNHDLIAIYEKCVKNLFA